MTSTATRRRTAALLLGTALVALGATACGPTADSGVSTKPKQSQSAGAGAGATSGGSAKSSSVAKVGDAIALKGNLSGEKADVTVVKVVDNAEGADDTTAPAEGKRFIAVQFQIKDTGAKAYSDAPSNGAKLIDAQGQAYAPTFADTKAGQGFSGGSANIAPGDSGLGFITFEVPKDARIVKVQFTLDSGMADQTGQWTVA